MIADFFWRIAMELQSKVSSIDQKGYIKKKALPLYCLNNSLNVKRHVSRR